jgi:cobalt-zinc-cadmium efflux system membrane fusion protein
VDYIEQQVLKEKEESMYCQIIFQRTIAAFHIAALVILLTSCGKEPEQSPIKEVIVAGSTVRFSPNSLTIQRLLTAPVVPAHESVLRLPARIVWDEDHTSRVVSPLAGHLDNVLVQIGSAVKANQPLAYLSSPELGNAQTESVRAQTDLAQAERNLSRIKDLAEAGVVAGKDLEQARADLERTRAEATRSSLRLRSMGATNMVDQRFAIRSPIAGVIVERNTNPGMEWRPDQPGMPLFVVSDATYLWCLIDAPERAFGMLQPGMKVMLRTSAWPQEVFEAKIDHVSDALDPASRTIKVRARLRNAERHLKGEMYVTAELNTQSHGVLDVPAKAVFLNNDTQQVFVKTAEGQYTRKTIVPVFANDQWVSIEQGLNKGDEVVVDGALYLEKMLEEEAQQLGIEAAPRKTSADKPPAK